MRTYGVAKSASEAVRLSSCVDCVFIPDGILSLDSLVNPASFLLRTTTPAASNIAVLLTESTCLLMTPYEKLKTMIYRGQLDSGQRIVERELAKKLGISRIPLREGMIRLENEGLIRSVPNSSNYVATFGPEDLIEIYSMRVWLEPPATRLATLRKDDKLISELGNWCRKMEDALEKDDSSKVDHCDYQFHYTIVCASGHSRLIRAYETAHIRITSFYSDFLMQKAAGASRLVRQHEKIIRAIDRGDLDRAAKAAYDHVYHSLDMFEKKLGVYLEGPPNE